MLLTQIIVLTLSSLVMADQNEKDLIRHLMDNYDRRVRPSLNSSCSTSVTFGLALAQLIDVDEKNQIITTNCWLNQAWIDVDLEWNPEDFGGIKTILLPYDSIWLPDILLYNSADVASSKNSAVSTNVIVTSTGNVTWLSTVIFKSSCTIDVRYFPFDEQNCSMVFASWTYDGSQLNMTLVDKKGDLSNYLPSSEFDLVNMYVERNVKYYSCCEHPFPDITYYVHLRRRPMFYVFNMLLPCFLITLVALLGFYIPSDSGEKVAMGITTLLSMTVFLMLVTEAMPPTADSLPLIGVYYFITMGIVSLATGLTVCTLNIHHKGLQGKSIPRWIRFICFRVLAPALCLKLQLPPPVTESTLYYNESAVNKDAEKRWDWDKHKLFSHKHKSPSQGVDVKYDIEERLLSSSKGSSGGRSYIKTPECRDVKSLCSSPVRTTKFNSKSSPQHTKKLGSSPLPSPTEANDPWILRHTSDPHIQQRIRKLEEFERNFTIVLRTMNETMKKGEQRIVASEHKEFIKREWQQVALVVDRLLLFLFVLVTVGVTLGLLLRGTISYAMASPMLPAKSAI